MRAAYEERRGLLLAGLAGAKLVKGPTPKGAFYVFADIQAARGDRDVWALVDEWLGFGVAVLPGTAFGPDHGDRVRLSLATRAEDVAEGGRRIAAHAGGTAPAGGPGTPRVVQKTGA
jgi:aspartate/methionine/tyrosine aminotransferase